MMRGTHLVTTIAKQVLDARMKGEKTLGVMSGLESSHLTFPLAGRLMRYFGAVVRVLLSIVDRSRQSIARGRPVAAKLVGDQPPRLLLLAIQDLAEKVLNGSPRIALLATDFYEHFVDVPGIAEPTLTPFQGLAIARPEFGERAKPGAAFPAWLMAGTLLPMVEDQPSPTPVYQLRIRLRGVSPPIWRRVKVSADMSIAGLHEVIQAAMGWEDIHLHQFTIRGQWYGVPRNWALTFHAGPEDLTLSAFGLRLFERFTYEYDFDSRWIHDIRVEKILPSSAAKELPVCMAGVGACPPEDSGPLERFMQLLDNRSVVDLVELLQDELESPDFSSERVVDLLDAWLPWVQAFDRKHANRRLRDPEYIG